MVIGFVLLGIILICLGAAFRNWCISIGERRADKKSQKFKRKYL